MKHFNLKLIGAIVCLSTTISSFSQNNWTINGNGNTTGATNFLGTTNNEPLNIKTNGIQRIRINENRPFGLSIINGHNMNRSGFVGIGPNSSNIFNNPIYGPFSLLHLNGGTGGLQLAGHHRWMRAGITITDNDDLAYVGLRALDAGNINEFTMTWSNNPNTPAGPDDMCFRFSNNQGSQTINTANLLDNMDDDGLHIARFTGTGFMGMGPTFGIDNAIYVAPQSLIHLSYVNRESVFTQYTNRNTNTGTGTGETASDGLRVGILGGPTGQRNGNALIYQQENRHLLLSTRANTTAIDMDDTQERVRITRIGAPTNIAGGGYGQYNPAGLPNNRTRVSISHNPNSPVTRPLSLLHIGYNTGLFSVPQGSTDGWRDWMDIGTFTTNGTDNMYVGLKRETGAVPANDRHDAVINWGDNGGSNQLNGPDNLRFIFTETTTGQGNPPANTNNGLEVARFDPQLASTIAAPNYGMMGIGDYSPAGPNAVPALAVDAKLDIDGDLRIRQVTEDTNAVRVLVIDTNDLNRVHYRNISDFNSFGTVCGSMNPLMLPNNSEIQLNTYDFHFSGNGQGKTQNNVGIGTQCNFPLAAKLMVNQNTTNEASTGIYVRNGDNSDATDGSPVSLFAIATGNDLQTSCNTIAGWFEARPSSGQQNIALCVPNSGGVVNIGFAAPDLTTPPTEPNVCANQMGTLGGLLAVNGPVSATGYITNPSDINLKTNISPITGALAKVKKLNGVYYDYDNTNYPNLNFSTERQVGLIAQNVDTVLTEVTVFDSSLQAYTLDYSRINALLIEAIKEQDTKVDSLEQLTETQDSINNDLENRLAVLEQCINEANLCSSTERTTNTTNENAGQSIELSNLNAIILDQNLPNPFAENTTITYSIPDDIMVAQLLFYDMNGRIIKQVDITDRGESKLTVYGNNLEKGIYTYSLIADGKLIATKKMVKQ